MVGGLKPGGVSPGPRYHGDQLQVVGAVTAGLRCVAGAIEGSEGVALSSNLSGRHTAARQLGLHVQVVL